MYSKANKILSIAMSAAILLTNMMTPMTAFADEVNEPAQDLESEMPPETEPVSYCLTLPFYDEVSYSVDKNYVVTNDSPGSKDIRLAYHEDDKVEFSFQTADTVQVMEIHLKDPKKQEYTFSVDENRNITLFMPAKDLELTLVMEENPVLDPVSETEQPAEPLPAAEAEGTWEQPVNPDEGINEFDLTAQEVAGDQTSYTAEDLSPGDDPAGGTDENISNNMNMKDRSAQADPENRDEETGTETGEDPADAVVETSKISEEASDETAGADSNPDTPGIVLTAETEEDGLPAQGSILTAETLTIPLMDVDFTPETDFTNISFSHETDQVELVSDEVDITNPGTYSTIYRVTHNDGEKMWYVLRPVLVSENTRAREAETEGAKGSPDVSDDETEEAEEESEAPSEEEALTEISLANETVMTETESETSFDETQEIPSPEDISERITEDVLEEPSEETTENAAEEMTESITEEVTEDAAAETAAGPYKVSAFADENVAVTFDHEDGLYESGDEVRFSISLIKEMEEPTVIEEITADFDNGVSVTQGIRVNENTGRVTFENLKEEKEVVVEDLPLADPLEDPGPEDEFQLSYEENEDLFSFEMPESNVMLTMMSAPLLAAAADDDDDPVPDKFKLIVKNAVTAPASLSSGYSASTRKWVTFYEDDGTKTKRVAYCVQPKEGSPESGHTYSKDQAELLDGDAGKEKMMTKGLYYLFGGPAWGKKIEYADGSGTVNLKNYLGKWCSTDDEYYVMSHFILSYIYLGGKNWNGNGNLSNVINSTGEEAIKHCVAELKKMSVPKAEFTMNSISAQYVNGTKVSSSVRYKAIDENVAKVTLPEGVVLVNETTGARSSGAVSIAGGDTFHLEAASGAAGLKTYSFKTTFPVDFTAMKLKLSGYQDIGFSYMSGDKTLSLSVSWPNESYVTVKKAASDGKAYDFSSCHIGLYNDMSAAQLLHEFVTGADGSSDVYKVTPGTYYLKEISVPAGWDINPNIIPVAVTEAYSTVETALAVSVPNNKKKPFEVRKVDKDTGRAEPFNVHYSFDGMEVTVYADAALTQAVQTIATDTAGHGRSMELSYGTYYVRETKPPKGYQVYDHTFTVEIGNEIKVDGAVSADAALVFTDEIIRKPITVKKFDKETGKDKPINSAATFAGAEYTVYSDEALTNVLEVITTGEDGTGESAPYPYETYYVKETKAPAGYLLDEAVYKVVIDDVVTVNGAAMDVIENKKAVVSSYEPVIRGGVSVMKYLDDNVDEAIMQDWIDNEKLKGIEFTLTHEDSSIEPVTVITDRFGHAATDNDTLVYGTWTVTESGGVPEGYQGLEKDSFKVEEDHVLLHYVISNKKPLFSIILHKKDAMTGELIPVKGALFTVADSNGNKITMPDNLDFSHLTDTFTTNEEGVIAFTKRLEPGTYTITEVKAPEGFLLAEPKTIKLTTDMEVKVPFICEAADVPQRGQIRVEKRDADTDETLKEGFSFDIFTAEDIKDASGKVRSEEIDGENVALKAGTRVDTISTGEDGTAITRELFLGSYKVVETASAEYYAVDETAQEVTLSYDEQVETVRYDLTVKDEKTKFDLFKVDSDTDQALAGITFRIFSTADKEAEKARQVAEAVEELRLGQEKEKQDLFEKQQLALENLGDVTEERRTEFIASQEEELEAFEAGLAKERAALEEKLMAELEITDISGLGTDFVTDENGQIHAEDLLHENTYYIYEIATLPGYNLDTAIHEFTVDDKGLINGQKSYTVKLTNQPNVVEISKKDITGGEELPGATLTLADSEGSVIETWVSGEEPHMIKGLPAGIYTLTETQAPEGYALAEEITFELTDSLTIQQVVMYDEQLQIHFSKKEITGDKELPGASLTLTDLEGNVIDEWVSGEEEHVINLKVGKYILTEIAAPEKYATAESIEFEVKADLSVQTVEMKDAPIQVEVSKKDITNKEELPGAHLQVIDVDGQVVEEWDSTTEPHMIILAVGTYTLVETIAPEGYATASAITFEVKDTAEIQKVEMFDDITKLQISKTDITNGEELPGARLTLKDQEGKVIEEWVSGEEPHYIEMLPVGTYTLTEDISPDGYGTAETITFEVKNTTELQTVEMKDAPYRQVEISKTDITTSKELPGAHVSVTDESGKVIDEWISTDKPHMMTLDAGKYILREEKAPDGYVTAEEVAFEVILAKDKDDIEIMRVEMKDDVTKVEISKQDITTEKELPGAKLIIKNEQGKEVESWTSTKEPHMIEKLPVGKYTLTEVTAPKGYDIAETVSFEVTDSAEIVHVKMMDKPKDELVDLTGKKKETSPGGYTVGAPGTPGTPVTSVISTPVKTGDYNRYLPAILLVVCGIAGLAGVFVGRKKKKLTNK